MLKYLQYIYLIAGCVIAATAHEYVKAIASAGQGDPTPKNRKRTTLNPRSHIEPLGLICMVITGGYGWGKPVETSPIYYKDRRKGTLITYITPSVVNLALGVLFMMLSSIFLYFVTDGFQTLFLHLYTCLRIFASVNIKLALFNIIPIYPLDGSKIFGLFLSPNSLVKYSNYEKLLQILLIFLLVSGLADMCFSPIANIFLNIGKIPL